jgi:protein tyrosine phosphatase type 4A
MVSQNKQINFTLIEHNNTCFYISEAPSKSNLDIFIDQVKEHKIKHIVRLCDPTYDKKDFIHDSKYDVEIHDWEFADGNEPPQDIIEKWKSLLKSTNEPILIHCRAGLGRAPTIAAIGLIEQKMETYNAIKLIRDQRPGSINSKQLKFLINYKPTSKKTNIFSRFFGF